MGCCVHEDRDSTGDAVTVVSVINYKGGVGKTTLTANIGAELAARGNQVLLIDLDPQASLTFSFYRADVWEKELADEHTLLQWFGSVLELGTPRPLGSFVLTPPQVNKVIADGGSSGRLDLLASHLGLIEVDLDFAYALGGSRFQHGSPSYLRIARSLANALSDDYFNKYDVVLIDCAPNFTMVTRTGIVASDYLLVPAKPDYLSTLGIDYLRRKIDELVRDYNKAASPTASPIGPEVLGIVLTMIQYGGVNPIIAMRGYIDQPTTKVDMPVFRQMIRENKSLYGTAGESGVPAVLATGATDTAVYELRELTNEFLARIRS
jgi:chromosome partitioning protein